MTGQNSSFCCTGTFIWWVIGWNNSISKHGLIGEMGACNMVQTLEK